MAWHSRMRLQVGCFVEWPRFSTTNCSKCKSITLKLGQKLPHRWHEATFTAVNNPSFLNPDSTASILEAIWYNSYYNAICKREWVVYLLARCMKNKNKTKITQLGIKKKLKGKPPWAVHISFEWNLHHNKYYTITSHFIRDSRVILCRTSICFQSIFSFSWNGLSRCQNTGPCWHDYIA